AGKKAPLPAMTQVMVEISNFITGNILIVLAVVIGFIILWKQYSNSDTGKRQLQGFFLKVPVVGSMMVKSATAKFSLSLSTLLHNGVPLDQALDITGRVSGNYLLAKSTEQIRESIIQGFALAESMAIHPIFPELIVKMVAVGEESGALAEMLSDIAEYYDEEVTQAVEGVSGIIEPIMIILIGAVVAVIVLGLYLPIFNMGNAMQGKM
ncbi:MAG: type II secretion system F family protein, partial [Candidatus Heimdallarchaeota archaeon]|nr:type II secretion system F family protein [Candidatus Heimdallarchaeota archaeon]